MNRLSWMEACIWAMAQHSWYSGRFSPDLRQAALEQDLGQIRCNDWHHEPDISIFGDCQACGAAL